jgi:hypothetical protein
VADPHSHPLTSLDWPLDLIWVDKEATMRNVTIYIKFKSDYLDYQFKCFNTFM